jgi:hypothetical protein
MEQHNHNIPFTVFWCIRKAQHIHVRLAWRLVTNEVEALKWATTIPKIRL